MTKEQLISIITYVLVALGGILITTGVVSDELWQTISGAVSGLAGSIWAIIVGAKKK